MRGIGVLLLFSVLAQVSSSFFQKPCQKLEKSDQIIKIISMFFYRIKVGKENRFKSSAFLWNGDDRKASCVDMLKIT